MPGCSESEIFGSKQQLKNSGFELITEPPESNIVLYRYIPRRKLVEAPGKKSLEVLGFKKLRLASNFSGYNFSESVLIHPDYKLGRLNSPARRLAKWDNYW